MNRYLIKNLYNGERMCDCLFRLPTELAVRADLSFTEIPILLIGNELIKFRRNTYDKVLLWKYHGQKKFRRMFYLAGEDHTVEFPDDDSARLWFMLEYGG